MIRFLSALALVVGLRAGEPANRDGTGWFRLAVTSDRSGAPTPTSDTTGTQQAVVIAGTNGFVAVSAEARFEFRLGRLVGNARERLMTRVELPPGADLVRRILGSDWDPLTYRLFPGDSLAGLERLVWTRPGILGTPVAKSEVAFDRDRWPADGVVTALERRPEGFPAWSRWTFDEFVDGGSGFYLPTRIIWKAISDPAIPAGKDQERVIGRWTVEVMDRVTKVPLREDILAGKLPDPRSGRPVYFEKFDLMDRISAKVPSMHEVSVRRSAGERQPALMGREVLRFWPLMVAGLMVVVGALVAFVRRASGGANRLRWRREGEKGDNRE